MEFLNEYKLEGEFLKIVKYPSPVLKKIAEPVTKFDDELVALCKNMLFTMYKAPGIGLAAPQVGKSIRLFVLDVDFDRSEVTRADGSLDYDYTDFNPLVFINPVFKNQSGELLYEEGCLSVPGIYEKVKRYEKISIEYYDLNGEQQSLDTESTLSVCIQHENDHLDGIVFLERLSMLKKNLLTKKYLKEKKRNQ